MKGIGRRFMIVLAMTTMLVSGAASAALAGPDSGSTISLVVLNSPDGAAHFGGEVTFNVVTSAEQPWVNVNCYQNGAWVYTQYQGFFAGYQWGQIFTLGPTQSWNSGDADCTARLFKVVNRRGKQTTLATTSFHAYA